MKNIADTYYNLFHRLYVYKRRNVRVQFDHPNMTDTHARLQYKIKLYGIIPIWKSVFSYSYDRHDRIDAITDPIRYADSMLIMNKGQKYERGRIRRVRQMMIKLKKNNLK